MTFKAHSMASSINRLVNRSNCSTLFLYLPQWVQLSPRAKLSPPWAWWAMDSPRIKPKPPWSDSANCQHRLPSSLTRGLRTRGPRNWPWAQPHIPGHRTFEISVSCLRSVSNTTCLSWFPQPAGMGGTTILTYSCKSFARLRKSQATSEYILSR